MKYFFNAYSRIFQKPLVFASVFGTINLLIIFHKKIGLWFSKYFIKDEIPVKTIRTFTDEFNERYKETFLNYRKSGKNDVNDNIEKEFYNKESFKEILEKDGNVLESNWKSRILMENTPRGNVYMFYDPYKLGFAYYSDVNSIPYHTLNAVAMKYCRIFKCMDFFIDQNIVSKENESPLVKIHHIEKKKNNDATDVKKTNRKLAEDGPFAKLKNYNEDKVKIETKDNKKDKKHINILTNRFIAMGKIYNMNILYKKPKDVVGFSSPLLDTLKNETNLQKDVMSYKDYKNNSER